MFQIIPIHIFIYHHLVLKTLISSFVTPKFKLLTIKRGLDITKLDADFNNAEFPLAKREPLSHISGNYFMLTF